VGGEGTEPEPPTAVTKGDSMPYINGVVMMILLLLSIALLCHYLIEIGKKHENNKKHEKNNR
jgi:hypothetical protein